MRKINQLQALIVGCFGIVLLLLSVFTMLFQQAWFVFLIALWLFVFSSCCYRLTPLFKARNGLDKFIRREQQHLLLFSLSGFFDRTHGPQWLPINSIKKIQCHDDQFLIIFSEQHQCSIGLPATKAELIQYFNALLTKNEKKLITIE
ncbi:MAG: hypothetical protein ACJAVX_003554 [Pseudoalteromonas rhizosphaerae]|jgi:hypothetical protein|uniref:YcxB family protein n=1 Tax=Pseudoalteromonas neustonica TaxID=1840331 RepID=A0ABY3FAC6_9GAMM|nr:MULTISPECIES: hypothetical protein [Pseudoalteromonas]MBB1507336.1 hypothetical protein [Pseudoalteromonas sp. SG41-1]TVU81479.1 hypothetical protein FQP85_16575 [Pseudoalteromonas neustonica]